MKKRFVSSPFSAWPLTASRSANIGGGVNSDGGQIPLLFW
ncbi:hypothetical protein V6Z12_D02G162700 [Gossypium hirsutum]